MGLDLLVAAVLGGIVTHFLAPFIGEYSKSKGKNLADKEDIQHLTELVESVKQENSLILEQVRARQQVRMAVAEKRLAAHQEAFVLWRGLMQVMHTDEVPGVVRTCQRWWEQNCLYLDARTRAAFMTAYRSAGEHRSILDGPRGEATALEAKANWARIMEAGLAIVEGVNLPALGEAEAVDVTKAPSAGELAGS